MGRERTLGDAIVDRLAGVKLDARAKAAAREFAAKHKAYVLADDAASRREEARDDALAAVGEADERLDGTIHKLADTLIGRGMAKRSAPFADFSEHTPSALCQLAYARQVGAAAKLTKAVRKAKPPKDVIAACNAVDAAAAKTSAALKGYDGKHKEWIKAAAARDAQLLDWQKALSRLRILSRASLIDDEGAYAALFAAPESITIAKRKRSRGAAPEPTSEPA